MTFLELYEFVRKQFDSHQDIVLDRDCLAVNIQDLFDNTFYILWQDRKLTVASYFYQDYHVCITSSERNLEMLFSERQYLFSRKSIFKNHQQRNGYFNAYYNQ